MMYSYGGFFIVIGGASLGSSDRWFNGIGMTDVLMNIVAFETINNVQIELRMSVEDNMGRADLRITCLANERQQGPLGPVTLASASVTCLSTNLKSLDAALIHALYLLDGELAREELRGEEVKKA